MTAQCIQCQVTSAGVCSACGGYGQVDGTYCSACVGTGIVSTVVCANVDCVNYKPDVSPPVHDGHNP